MRCPGCGSPHQTPILRRTAVPVHQNLLYPTRAEALHAPTGELRISRCQHCQLVFNAAFDPALMRYGADYENDQSLSPAFRAHLQQRVEALLASVSDSHTGWLEIGCGNGRFLCQLLAQPAAAAMSGWGFDPSYRGPAHAGRLRFEATLLNRLNFPAGVQRIVCRHVIEHIAQPLAWLSDLRQLLPPEPELRLFFETPALEWIAEGQVFWDFFYEHCNYFTWPALAGLFARAGFEVSAPQRVFGGQYYWWEARPVSLPLAFTPPEPPLSLAAFGDQSAWLAAIVTQFQQHRQQGALALWGAGAKGVTLAGLADPGARWLDCVVDINPHKQGRFLPGTGHPIIAPTELGARAIRTVCVLNPGYMAEIRAQIQQLGLSVDVVQLVC